MLFAAPHLTGMSRRGRIKDVARQHLPWRRLVATVVLAVLMPIAYVSAECAGWSNSAARRMACCERSGGACASVSADSCCADAEQRQNLNTVSILLVTAPLTVPERLVPAPVARWSLDHPETRRVRRATYLLDAVFRI
jgi:hypothetical protein